MKKGILLSVFFLMLYGLIGCSQLQKEEIEVKQIVLAKEIMDSIQKEMETTQVKVINGILSDATTKEPLYQLMDIFSEEETQYFPSIKHFDLKDINGGYILEPIDPTKSSELIIVVEAVDSEAAGNVTNSLQKVLSDQYKEWEEHIPGEYQLVKTNKIVNQGDFTIYVTSKEHKSIIKAFQEIAR